MEWPATQCIYLLSYSGFNSVQIHWIPAVYARLCWVFSYAASYFILVISLWEKLKRWYSVHLTDDKAEAGLLSWRASKAGFIPDAQTQSSGLLAPSPKIAHLLHTHTLLTHNTAGATGKKQKTQWNSLGFKCERKYFSGTCTQQNPQPQVFDWMKVDKHSRDWREGRAQWNWVLPGGINLHAFLQSHAFILASTYVFPFPLLCFNPPPTFCRVIDPHVDLLCRNWETSSSWGMLSSRKPQYFSRSGKMWLYS